VNTAIAIWADQAAADAFQQATHLLGRTLDALGQRLESSTSGEVLVQVTASL